MATSRRHTVLGIMSGSSLDGLDLALCQFTLTADQRNPLADWSVVEATTVAYPDGWQDRLRRATELPAPDLFALHAALGDFIGEQSVRFLQRSPDTPPSLVGCHGHTVYHEPSVGYSIQLGEGSHLAARLQLPVVTELRTADIAAGGQGAPLAPLADRHLFPDYSAFLNLGGIANFSLRHTDGSFIAGDVSGCCQILDRLARQAGQDFDREGQIARSGHYRPALARQLDQLAFHHLPYPKSLSNAWVTDTLWPLLRTEELTVADRLHTFTHWLASKIAEDMSVEGDHLGGAAGATQVLVSGGGTRNTYLLEQLQRATTELDFVAGNDTTTDFKEAALIALCALFRQQLIPNGLASATGADRDTINGALYAA